MKFGRANKLVLGMMRGSKRDTLLLFVVVLLVVLFMTALSIFITSLDVTESARRESLYGGWQTLFYGADEQTREDMAALADETAAAQFIGDKSNIGTVVAASDQWLDMSSIKLQSGELPRNKGEIALVASPDTDGISVGDTVKVEYTYYHLSQPEPGGSILDKCPWLEDYVDFSNEELVTKASQSWFEYGGGIIKFDYIEHEEVVDGETVTFVESVPVYGEGPEDFMKMDETERKEYMAGFIMGYNNFGQNVYTYEVGKGTRRGSPSHGYEGVQMRLDTEQETYQLRGSGFGEDQGSTIEGPLRNVQLKAWREYTVTGIVEPYAELWDCRGLDLPDAFVTEGEAEHMTAAVELMEREENTMPLRPQYIVMSRSPTLTAAQLYDAQLPIYTAGGAGRYSFSVAASGYVSTDERVSISIGGQDENGEYMGYYSRGYASILNGNVAIPDGKGGASYVSILDARNGRLDLPGFDPVPAEHLSSEKAYVFQDYEYYRINSYAYPIAGGSSVGAMGELMGVGIYIVAFFAIFQIYLAQSRRRSRRGGVMKAIGATGGQVFAINMLEGAYIVAAALPVGIALGFGAAVLACRYGGEAEMVFSVDLPSLVTSILGCVAAVAIGMLLTGAFTARASAGRERPIKERAPRAASKRRGLLWRMFRITGLRKAAALTLLVTLFCGILLVSVFFGNFSYSKYRDEVESINAADYRLDLSYGLHRRYVEDTVTELESSEGIDSVAIYPVGRQIMIGCKGKLGSSELLAAQAEENFTSFERLAGGTETGLFAKLYAVDFTDGEMVAALEGCLGSGALSDMDALAAGTACILLQPRSDERMELSASPRDAYVYKVDDIFGPGDELELCAENHRRTGGGMVTTTEYKYATVKVQAVINTTDIYPFSASQDAVTIIGSDELLHTLYPLSGRKMSAQEVKDYEDYSMLLYGESYGRTEIYAYSDGSGAPGDIAVYRTSDNIGSEVTNNRSLNEKLYAEAQNGMIMIVALCAMAAAIVYAIYINIAGSVVEGERHHIGVLNAVGAPRERQTACYAAYAAIVGVISVVLANLLFCAAVFITSLIVGHGFVSPEYITEVVLQNYPWAAHIAITLGTFVLCVAAYFTAAMRVCRRTPLDNIRS